MPTYDFKCEHGHVTSQFMQMSAVPDHIDCPDCWLIAKRQLGAGAPPMFKGSGFFCNDYKTKKPPEKPAE